MPEPLHLLCLTGEVKIVDALEEAFSLAGLQSAVHLEVSESAADPDPEKLARADAVICGSFPRALRAQAPRLRWVQFWSAGVDGRLYPELFTDLAGGAGTVTIATAAGIHAASASEHVLSLMLAFARGLPQSFRAQQEKDWSARDAIGDAVFELEGKTVGIVGAGQIGQAIGLRCQAFGMRTVGTRRDPTRPTRGIDVLLSHLQYHDLILSSDLIVLALPLTPNTRMLFGEDEIEILRKGTYLFNIGRGGLLDEAWVAKALEKRWLAGAGLDVFTDEPLPPSSPFWTLPNCIVTPHTGGVTPRYWPRFAQLVTRQIVHLQNGEPLENQVDRDLGY
ncbi:MAG: D-2-hydroxyacid dehydrogenase [Cytophagales bacterium]|nr:D-2-hydroxyacid dehydrogenase [Armatimonadota bacterium]